MTQTVEIEKTVIGIDYSLTSPAISIDNGALMFFYLTSKKKWAMTMNDTIVGEAHKEYKTDIERFKNISDFAINVIQSTHNPYVYIEGYSFGSKGRGVFQIAENCGILKYRLEELNIPYKIVVPSVVKKFATGKGNADKDKMYEAFKKDLKIDLKKIFDTEKVGNPISDIVDSYYIAKCGADNEFN